jgi:hypothetical protein
MTSGRITFRTVSYGALSGLAAATASLFVARAAGELRMICCSTLALLVIGFPRLRLPLSEHATRNG